MVVVQNVMYCNSPGVMFTPQFDRQALYTLQIINFHAATVVLSHEDDLLAKSTSSFLVYLLPLMSLPGTPVNLSLLDRRYTKFKKNSDENSLQGVLVFTIQSTANFNNEIHHCHYYRCRRFRCLRFSITVCFTDTGSNIINYHSTTGSNSICI